MCNANRGGKLLLLLLLLVCSSSGGSGSKGHGHGLLGMEVGGVGDLKDIWRWEGTRSTNNTRSTGGNDA